jgi:hypothetical protein
VRHIDRRLGVEIPTRVFAQTQPADAHALQAQRTPPETTRRLSLELWHH